MCKTTRTASIAAATWYKPTNYHPALLGAADPIEGCILCYRNVQYFLPPNDDVDYLVETVLNQSFFFKESPESRGTIKF